MESDAEINVKSSFYVNVPSINLCFLYYFVFIIYCLLFIVYIQKFTIVHITSSSNIFFPLNQRCLHVLTWLVFKTRARPTKLRGADPIRGRANKNMRLIKKGSGPAMQDCASTRMQPRTKHREVLFEREQLLTEHIDSLYKKIYI